MNNAKEERADRYPRKMDQTFLPLDQENFKIFAASDVSAMVVT